MTAANWLTVVYCFGHPNEYDATFTKFWWLKRIYAKASPWNLTLFWLILFEVIHGLAIVSHMMAVCSDPGSLEVHKCPQRLPDEVLSRHMQMRPEDVELIVGSKCEKCKGRWKPPRAHHCNRCDKCIFRMDHHCSWIGNCIGQANQKYFILFLAYTILGALLNIVSFPVMWASCWWLDRCQLMRRSFYIGLTIVVICSCLGLMAKTYLSEMVEAIKTNSTLVESYQGTHGKQLPLDDALKEIFGTQKWLWWLPIPPDITLDFTEMVWRDVPISKQPAPAKEAGLSSLHRGKCRMSEDTPSSFEDDESTKTE
eukprot:Blabericola_migrator_1__1214@NODE_1310_length_4840_cov_138_493400_g882_i0_p3_GENE_NODE_1310_length_4840_cov_138_493400_g882_i0NODE_1310_length_4840_cov_138_493400_g882_i0_p3_ORF_typecomplete_len347_score32_39DHHC/PF01529_20/1_5e02DHHC/PF01529_20/1_4e29_NODE_1310_length_4840_cov_138_493400_g882_i01091041